MVITQKASPTIGELAEAIACPVCRSEKSRIYHIGVREDAERLVYICSHCRLQFIEPPFTNLREYYREEYRKSHETRPGEQMTSEERFKVDQILSHGSSLVFKDHVPKGMSVLEIGPSSGGFLSHLQDDYECYGNEWNPEDAAYIRDVGDLPCEEGDISEVYPGKKFGCIAARAVIEHVADPIAWLLSLKERLIGGGWLYLETPNANDPLLTVYDIPEYKMFWYRMPHITYWNAEVLAATLTRCAIQARVSYFQRYGLMNHMSWNITRAPMPDPIAARQLWKPVNKTHPAAPTWNRDTVNIDQQYRLSCEAHLATDSLRVIGCQREI